VTIGEFSTMTRLSRKALRHYHELGLLEPVEVDPATGYRYYDTTQVEVARLIRRFRDLEMPVPDLKAYVAAPDPAARREIVVAHLDRMTAQLRQTEEAVSALRALLIPIADPPHVEVRAERDLLAIAITETVPLEVLVAWWRVASSELHDALVASGSTAIGPLCGIYEQALFSEEYGEATVYFPVAAPLPEVGRVRMTVVPGGDFAVAIHDGPDERVDETYAALGSYAAVHGISAEGPVRERYLAGVLDDPTPIVTEISWPITALAQQEPRNT
jgi:DNA-binding transcriptional MerR regulator